MRHARAVCGGVLTIRVAGTINVSIMPIRSLVLNVRGVDGDTTRTLLGSLVNISVVREFGSSGLCQYLRYCGCKSCLAVVDVT